ncbi:MAG: SPOR domain-containing protein [Gemmatimonadota bacterium]|nr:SPOR domain-containing protein [Gemmatimonadota bacterium]
MRARIRGRRSVRGGVIVVLLGVAPMGGAGGQTLPSLDRVEELIGVGRTQDARTVLMSWWDSSREGAGRRDLQRGFWLRARLTVDPSQASLDYQRLVIQYPGGPYSDAALLRLAQAARSRGDEELSQSYLTSLERDYPSSSVLAEARAWSAGSGGTADAGGEAVERVAAGSAGAPPEVVTTVADSSARPGVVVPATPPRDSTPARADPTPVRTDPTPMRVDPTPARVDPMPARVDSTPVRMDPTPVRVDSSNVSVAPPTQSAAPVGRPREEPRAFTVQLGAYSNPDGARRVHDDARAGGLAARMVRTPGDDLIRVRVGKFATRDEAAALRDALVARGMSAAIATDATTEEVVGR